VFKRITWLGIGMAVGAGGAFRAKRKLEETMDRYLPEQVADRATTSARNLSRTVRAAATEGRDAMRATEAELRGQVDQKTFTGIRPEPQPVSTPAAGPRRLPRTSRPNSDQPGSRRRARR